MQDRQGRAKFWIAAQKNHAVFALFIYLFIPPGSLTFYASKELVQPDFVPTSPSRAELSERWNPKVKSCSRSF